MLFSTPDRLLLKRNRFYKRMIVGLSSRVHIAYSLCRHHESQNPSALNALINWINASDSTMPTDRESYVLYYQRSDSQYDESLQITALSNKCCKTFRTDGESQRTALVSSLSGCQWFVWQQMIETKRFFLLLLDWQKGSAGSASDLNVDTFFMEIIIETYFELKNVVIRLCFRKRSGRFFSQNLELKAEIPWRFFLVLFLFCLLYQFSTSVFKQWVCATHYLYCIFFYWPIWFWLQ